MLSTPVPIRRPRALGSMSRHAPSIAATGRRVSPSSSQPGAPATAQREPSTAGRDPIRASVYLRDHIRSYTARVLTVMPPRVGHEVSAPRHGGLLSANSGPQPAGHSHTHPLLTAQPGSGCVRTPHRDTDAAKVRRALPRPVFGVTVTTPGYGLAAGPGQGPGQRSGTPTPVPVPTAGGAETPR